MELSRTKKIRADIENFKNKVDVNDIDRYLREVRSRNRHKRLVIDYKGNPLVHFDRKCSSYSNPMRVTKF